MDFIYGLLTGFLIVVSIFVILTFFRAGIEKKLKIIERTLSAAGPKPKGFIDVPEDEDEIERQEIIAKNRKAGRDTPIKDLL